MVDLVAKDLRLVTEFAQEAGVQLPATEHVQKMYAVVQQMGLGREGTQAIYKALEQINARPRP
jgi:3-hydroxyisobutyrate dehydrogenase-like beta-hydroxyacid dehydrogenase